MVATPGVLAAIWGVVLFGENRGRQNLLLLLLVIALQATNREGVCIADVRTSIPMHVTATSS